MKSTQNILPAPPPPLGNAAGELFSPGILQPNARRRYVRRRRRLFTGRMCPTDGYKSSLYTRHLACTPLH